ncbi:MAG TPA: hypothetical protein VFS43_36810 [Polyangiaceae bacterium]|nr:hypothetical protein [Polyangiaceae bacterium]
MSAGRAGANAPPGRATAGGAASTPAARRPPASAPRGPAPARERSANGKQLSKASWQQTPNCQQSSEQKQPDVG